MDDPLLSRKIAEESSRRPGRELSPSYLDLGQSLRQSTSHLVTSDVIIPIITTPKTSSYVNLIASLNKKKTRLPYRSHSAPSLFTDARDTFSDSFDPRPGPKSIPLIVRQAFVGVVLYILVVVLVFLVSGSFRGTTTFKPVDALYFTVVTLCTIGYGDIVPDTTFTKLFTCGFILVGFGIIDILLNGLVTYICDRQEAFLLSTMDGSAPSTMVQAYMIDKSKGRMRIRSKVVLASAVVIVCIAVGTITVHYLEKLDWVDSFYLAVTSVTTVGYGDFAFTTLTGRCFAIIWLLVSTLAVARAFLYLTELRIDRRNRRIAKWVLQKKMTLGDLVAADLDNDGSISKSEFVIYKLKEMGKIAEKDILQICNQFDSIDSVNCGKITLADLMESDNT
uniref:Potassium channel domain-containing protein n=1 Tax=Salix viminalis TaxID=40686 RepID=A0A6N2NGU7_SALVM